MEEDYSGLFMQWAMTTLQHEHLAVTPIDGGGGGGEEEATFPSLQALREASQAAEMIQELIAEPHAANSSCCSGDGGDAADSGSVGNISRPAAPTRSSSCSMPASWNFGAVPAPPPGRDGAMPGSAAGSLPVPDLAYGSPPTRRAVLRSVGSVYAQDHIIAERKRREKINQRFIELSTVIPGLKKMDKATILSDATRYVKELQEKVKAAAVEDGSSDRSIESWVLVRKPCTAAPDEDAGSPSRDSSGTPPARNPLPEIEARFLESEKNVMVRIHCVDGKGVVVRVLAELEELHLRIIHTNVMPFPACTLIITITAKVDEGFTVTAEEIVGRLKSAVLMHQQISCNNSAEETA